MANVRRPAGERQAYHFRMYKKGTLADDGRKLSDFERGVHLGKAQMIQKQRMNSAKYYKRQMAKDYKEIFK